jgi:hypothetical protein
MVDLDPQGNATMGSGVDKRSLELTVYDVLLESASVKEAAVLSDKCGYWVLGANRELAGAEVELVALEHREKRLKAALAEVDATTTLCSSTARRPCRCSPSTACAARTASSCPCSANTLRSKA